MTNSTSPARFLPGGGIQTGNDSYSYRENGYRLFFLRQIAECGIMHIYLL